MVIDKDGPLFYLLHPSLFFLLVGVAVKGGPISVLSVSNSIGMIKHTDYHGFICQHRALLPQLYSVTILDVIV